MRRELSRWLTVLVVGKLARCEQPTLLVLDIHVNELAHWPAQHYRVSNDVGQRGTSPRASPNSQGFRFIPIAGPISAVDPLKERIAIVSEGVRDAAAELVVS